MLDDRYGNPISTTSADARDAYIEGVDHILAATYGAIEAFGQVLRADPGFALGHIGMARAQMYAADMAGARASVERALKLSKGITSRERQHIAIFDLMLGGQPAAARDAVWAHVRDFPRDALAAQLNTNVFGLIGFSGRPGREAELFAYTSQLSPHYGEDWWMMSMHSLSMCEIGRPADALELMEKSMALNPRNANGSHFKAHELYELGEAETGLSYLRDWMVDYDRRALLHGHNSWHAALWQLELGQIDAMWATVDGSVAPGASESLPINVVTDTASLYWRAAMKGVEIDPERWKILSDYTSRMFPKAGQSFVDMHAALAHAMAGDGAKLSKLTTVTNGFAGDLVAPVARAWRSFAAQDWKQALTDLTPLLFDHARIGGSRAQRDLIELTYVHVLLKLGQTDEARRALLARRPIFADNAPLEGVPA